MENIDLLVKELQGYFCPCWYLDLKAAIEHWAEVDLTPSDIFDLIDDQREITGFNQQEGFDNIDPVYCVLDHILQMARNELEAVIDYDFVNDFRGGTEFYTYGNFMCSSYDYSEEAKDQLIERLDNASSEQLQQLRENRFVCTFLDHVEIDITEPE